MKPTTISVAPSSRKGSVVGNDATAIMEELRKVDKNHDGTIDEEELLAVVRKVVKLRKRTRQAWRIAGLGVLFGALIAACMLGVVIWGIEMSKDIETGGSVSSDVSSSTSTLRDKHTGQLLSVASANIDIEFNSNSETNLPTNPDDEAAEVARHFSARRMHTLGSSFNALSEGGSTLTFGERLDLVKASDLEQMEAFTLFDKNGRAVSYAVAEYDFRGVGDFTIYTATGVELTWADHQLHRTLRNGSTELLHDEGTADGLAASISASRSSRFGRLATAPAFSGTVRMRPAWSLGSFLPRGPLNETLYEQAHTLARQAADFSTAAVDCSYANWHEHYTCDMEHDSSRWDSSWCQEWKVCKAHTWDSQGRQYCVEYMNTAPCHKDSDTCTASQVCGTMNNWPTTNKCTKCFRPPSCFSADVAVTLFDGSRKRMDDVRIGDALRCDGTAPCTVIGFLHRSTTESTAFLQMHFEGAKHPLEVTPEHVVFMTAADGQRESVRADSVRIGASLYTAGGVSRKVIDITEVVKGGYFSPLTDNDGTLVVNGVLASSYTSYDFMPSIVAENHDRIHVLFAPLRLLRLLTDALFPQTAEETSLQHGAEGQMHWYANALCSSIGGCFG